MTNIVHEHVDSLNNDVAQMFSGESVGLFLQHNHVEHEGDNIGNDSDLSDITTEPDNAGYQRQTLPDNENPTFDVSGYDGAVDAIFIVDDDDTLLAAFPLGVPVDTTGDTRSITPQIHDNPVGK